MKKKGGNFIKGITFGLLLGLAGGFFMFSGGGGDGTFQEAPGRLSTREPVTEETGNPDIRRYVNKDYGFSLEYPSDLSVVEYSEGADSQTIVFQRGRELHGFQIYITPYNRKEITESRIRQDIPSGVVENPLEVLIGRDGTQRAMAFLSQNTLMGETREVWFIHDGYLFEATTYRALDSWLAEILRSLSFE